MKVLFLRHCEQPVVKDVSNLEQRQVLEKEDSEIGATLQGSVRILKTQSIVKKIIGNKKYSLHTYTNTKHDIPVSRAYFTTQLLREDPKCKSVTLYQKSEEIYELVENLRNQSKNYKYAVVCWEHARIPKILQDLLYLDKEPNYEKIVKNFEKKNYDITYEVVEESDVEHIIRCAEFMQDENDKYINQTISGIKELEYSPVWIANIKKQKYKVFPGLVIKKGKEKQWNLVWYI